MARKPNYRFDRQERDRANVAKRAKRLKTKEEKALNSRQVTEVEPTQEKPDPSDD